METPIQPTSFTTNDRTKTSQDQFLDRNGRYDAGDTNAPRYNQRVVGSFVTCILAMATSGSGSFTPSVLIGTTWQVQAPISLLVFFIASIVTAVEIGKWWWGRIVREVDSVVLRVSSSQALSRIKSSMSASSLRIAHFANLGGRKQQASSDPKRCITVAATVPFHCPSEVAKLTVTDLRDLVQYVSDMNRLDFNKEHFVSTMSENGQQAAVALSKAMISSRGLKVVMSTQPIGGDTSKAEDMDALGFLALTRIIAEWRSVRMVPPGYKRYAMSMGFAHRDLVQNIQKVETAVHNYLSHRENSSPAAVDYANGRQVRGITLYIEINMLISFLCSFPVQP